MSTGLVWADQCFELVQQLLGIQAEKLLKNTRGTKYVPFYNSIEARGTREWVDEECCCWKRGFLPPIVRLKASEPNSRHTSTPVRER
jgi:hypothetical protein